MVNWKNTIVNWKKKYGKGIRGLNTQTHAPKEEQQNNISINGSTRRYV